jgi:hypothetical protein
VKSPLGTPGSARHSIAFLCATAAAAVVVLGLMDGIAAAATGLALCIAAGLGVARYVTGAGSQDSGYRKSVRLLAARAPGLGEWRHIVRKSLGDDAGLHFATTLRPQLQRLFAARLAERHGVQLHASPGRARTLVGPDLWPWIDPAALPPEPAIPESALRALLARLETL